MSFLQALDTAIAIAMTLIYFLLSLVVAALTEGIATMLKLRSKTLYTWILGVVRDPKAAANFYDHPLIRTLEQVAGTQLKPIRKPSYIPSRTFAVAALDYLNVNSGTLPWARATVKAIQPRDSRYGLAQTVLPILEDATGSIKDSQIALATWFDSSMDRVSGWYKRRIIKITLPLSLLIAVLANASTVELVHLLWNDQALRQAFVTQAQIMTEDGQLVCEFSRQEGCISLDASINNLPLPLGWNFCNVPETEEHCIKPRNANSDLNQLTLMGEARRNLLGWLTTAVLLSFGSRFWFDALSKLVNIRLAGQKPSESDTSNKKGT
jgi:hypothetical protein